MVFGWELSLEPFLPVGSLSPVSQRVNGLHPRGKCQRIGAGFGCGRPGSLCVVQTAVLGCRAAGEKSRAAGNALNPAKKGSVGFSARPCLCFVSAHSSPFSEPRSRVVLPSGGRRKLRTGLASGLFPLLSSLRAPPGDLVLGGQRIGGRGAAWEHKY